MENIIVGEVVGPGDPLGALPESGTLRVGPGLLAHEGQLVTSKAGIVRRTRAGKVWVEGRQKRYAPAVDDMVVGICLDRFYDSNTIDIGGPFNAVLPALAFEGATRRNRPHLNAGDLVYARVVSAPRDADPEIVCTDQTGRSGGFGPLKEGLMFTGSTRLMRQLLANPPAPIFSILGQKLPFEVAVGQNGRAWVKGGDTFSTILIANCLQRSEFLTPGQQETLVNKALRVRPDT